MADQDEPALTIPPDWDVDTILWMHTWNCWRCRFVLTIGWRHRSPRRADRQLRRGDPGE
jgi:hypothetical protein